MSPGTTEFVAFDEITRQLNVHPNTTRKRIRVANIPTFSDPHDRRKILVLAEDAARLTQPLLISRENKGGKPATITG